jgi:nucleoid DNA-binding protein
MKKEQVARRLARETHTSTAMAADQVDRIVSDLLLKVRRGQAVSLPGLGTFQAGTQKEFQFEGKERQKSRKAKG